MLSAVFALRWGYLIIAGVAAVIGIVDIVNGRRKAAIADFAATLISMALATILNYAPTSMPFCLTPITLAALATSLPAAYAWIMLIVVYPSAKLIELITPIERKLPEWVSALVDDEGAAQKLVAIAASGLVFFCISTYLWHLAWLQSTGF